MKIKPCQDRVFNSLKRRFAEQGKKFLKNESQGEKMRIGEFIRRATVPLGYIQDQMTSGPVLPTGWTGDAWQAQDDDPGYFLRAWNDGTGQVAVIHSETSYEDAANRLREKAQKGGDWIATVQQRDSS